MLETSKFTCDECRIYKTFTFTVSVVDQSGDVGERGEEAELRGGSSDHRQSSHQVLEETAGYEWMGRAAIAGGLSFFSLKMVCVSSCRRFGGEEEGRRSCELVLHLQGLRRR